VWCPEPATDYSGPGWFLIEDIARLISRGGLFDEEQWISAPVRSKKLQPEIGLAAAL